jgi:hypothetical protein
MEPAALMLCVCHTRFSGVWQKAAGGSTVIKQMMVNKILFIIIPFLRVKSEE